MSQDIHSFIQYQAITEEPFLEKRKYELKGKIVNNEQIPIFIYQEKKFFGDIEIISGRNTSMFNIVANEDNSSLYVIDRIKWVRLTKRIRIMFTRMTLKKIEMIYERIFEVLKGKNYLNIDKMKLYKDKIHEQIEITNNFDIYSKKIQKKEKKLQNELDKIKLNKQNEKLKEEKSKSLRNFQYSKEYLINLFKFPNILKEDKKSDLEKYLFVNKNKDTQRFKLRNTISKFNIDPDLAKNNIVLQVVENINENYDYIVSDKMMTLIIKNLREEYNQKFICKSKFKVDTNGINEEPDLMVVQNSEIYYFNDFELIDKDLYSSLFKKNNSGNFCSCYFLSLFDL
jgi:hypothetical protein